MSELPLSSIRVDVFNSLLAGGASNAARGLTQSLRDRGVDARVFYSPLVNQTDPGVSWIQPARWKSTFPKSIIDSISFRMYRERFKSVIRQRPLGSELFSSPRGAPGTPWPPRNLGSREKNPPSIVHLHWMAKFIDWKSFWQSMPAHQIVVWTLHDMNPFTGGCHFASGCRRFVDGCGQCPQLPKPSPNDFSREFLEIKRASLRSVRLHVVTASQWLSDMAKQSPVFENVESFHRIPYGLPIDQCQPIDREVARAKLGIAQTPFVFAFGALDLDIRRKGIPELMEAMRRLGRRDDVIGLALGDGHMDLSDIGFEVRSLGSIPTLKQRIEIYSACNAFVLPSTEDNFPLTGLEALASGTPIIAFDIGGIPDFVRHQETGLLSEVDPAALATNLQRLIDGPSLTKVLGNQARELAIAEYDRATEADRYIDLYRTLISQR
jgi:glycosyltransferase involved in cell wall biosynthesis